MAGSQRQSVADESAEKTHVEEGWQSRCDPAAQGLIILPQRALPFGVVETLERELTSSIRASAPLGDYSNNDSHQEPV